jgi:hypothetical protein
MAFLAFLPTTIFTAYDYQHLHTIPAFENGTWKWCVLEVVFRVLKYGPLLLQEKWGGWFK